jgi:hypothetical protein
MSSGFVGVSLGFSSHKLAFQGFNIRDATVEALTTKDA